MPAVAARGRRLRADACITPRRWRPRQVLLRHVALAAADPLRTMQLQEAVAAAARAAAARAPEAALLQARAPRPAGPSLRRAGHFAGADGRGARGAQEVGWLDPGLEAALRQLLSQPA